MLDPLALGGKIDVRKCVLLEENGMFSVLTLGVFPAFCVSLQFAPHHLLPAVQAHSGGMCLHPPGL